METPPVWNDDGSSRRLGIGSRSILRRNLVVHISDFRRGFVYLYDFMRFMLWDEVVEIWHFSNDDYWTSFLPISG